MSIKMRTFAAVCAMAAVGACSFELGEAVDRSMNGLLGLTDAAPRGVSYLLAAEYTRSSITVESATDYAIIPIFVGLAVVREGQDFRLSPGVGSMEVPPELISDSRSLYVIPGGRERFVLEYNFVNEDGSRQLRATLAERRCQGDTCVLAIADELPVNDDGGVSIVETASCREAGCEEMILDGQAFAAAVAQISARMSAEDFDDYFLIYQPASE